MGSFDRASAGSGAFRDKKQLAQFAGVLAVKNRDGAGPTCRGLVYLYREAGHHEAACGQLLEIVQFLDMAIANIAAGLVAFPNDTGITGLSVSFSRIYKRCVP